MQWNVAGYLVIISMVLSAYHQVYDHLTVYASEDVKHQYFIVKSDSFTNDLPEPYQDLILKTNESGNYIWYLYLHTPVCMTGECKEVDVGLFWHFDGEFLGYEVYQEHLTRTDHSQFSDSDYERLTQVLADKSSILGEYAYDDLLITPADSSVDGITGATRQDITSEAVDGAVYTCFTLWHICHGAIKVYIEDLTSALIADSALELADTIGARDVRFLLGMLIDGKIRYQKGFEDLIFNALEDPDIEMKRVALEALSRMPLGDKQLQDKLANYFSNFSLQEKMRVLKYLKEVQLSSDFLKAISHHENFKNPWLAANILDLLSTYPLQDASHVRVAKELSMHSKDYIRKPALRFLEGMKIR